MPTPTYTPLANITLATNTTTITFSSISQAYRDLVLVCNGKSSTSTAQASITANGNSGANYSYIFAGGNGSTTLSQSSTGQSSYAFGNGRSYINTSPGWNLVVNFMDYSATDKHKSLVARENHSDLGTDMWAMRWANTAAITSLTITGNGTFATGSTFALYGIAA